MIVTTDAENAVAGLVDLLTLREVGTAHISIAEAPETDMALGSSQAQVFVGRSERQPHGPQLEAEDVLGRAARERVLERGTDEHLVLGCPAVAPVGAELVAGRVDPPRSRGGVRLVRDGQPTGCRRARRDAPSRTVDHAVEPIGQKPRNGSTGNFSLKPSVPANWVP